MRRLLAGMALLLCCFAVGCGGSAATNDAPAAQAAAKPVPPPDVAVRAFLEAVRTGNDTGAAELLTPLAKQKTQEMELQVAPPGSATASYKIGAVEYIAEDGAHVATEWTDVDAETGAPQTDPIIWMVQRQPDGWRIAGMATKVFEDQPPLFLNFEDPEDMLRKQQLVAAEIERRANPQAQPAGATAQTGQPISGNAAAAPAATPVGATPAAPQGVQKASATIGQAPANTPRR